MSGGVDSSVSAALLKEQGYEVIGVHMRCYNVDGCAAGDAEDARRAAEVLRIPFYVFDFEKEYKETVVDYMVRGYLEGITPNPDVMCNKEIKFGLFFAKALEMGADYIATGHYVRLQARKNSLSSTRFGRSSGGLRLSSQRRGFDGAPRQIISKPPSSPAPEVSEKTIFSLFVANDKNKDQSYFLWTLTQNQLKHCLFPIGDYLKPEVRALARRFGLPNADKKDSQGICFLGKVTLRDFLGDYIKPRPGSVILSDSEGSHIIGEHEGVHFYTIGQRHGLDLGTRGKGLGARDFRPLYVAEKDINTNSIVVAEGADNPALYSKEIVLTDVNFINSKHTNILENVGMSGLGVYARIRYRQPLAKATLKLINPDARSGSRLSDKKNNKGRRDSITYQLIFEVPQKFVAPGQSAVFYSKDGEMLGGGIINSCL